MTMFEGTFVCANCGREKRNDELRFTLGDGAEQRMFCSPECMTEWQLNGGQPRS